MTLDIAEQFLAREIAPSANKIDRDESALRVALSRLVEHQLICLRRPSEYGGPETDEITFRLFQESVARYSGSLAFLQTQHQSAVNMISKWGNEEVKRKYLPQMHGPVLMGIGFSQLRRKGEPLLKAEEVPDGFIINGEVPWVTGESFFNTLLLGAALPNGSSVFGVVPFENIEQDGGKIQLSPPMKLAAMETPRTVSANVENWRLDSQNFAFIQPTGWLANNDMVNVTLQGWFALGCARAGLDIIQKNYESKRLEFLRQSWQVLDNELEVCRASILKVESALEQRLQARAWAIELAARCTHAAVAASSGAANSIEHDAQRVYREALVYTVSAQTTEIMEATLKRLVKRGILD